MIYFWEINKLKFDLINRNVSNRQSLTYFLCILFVQVVSWGLTAFTEEPYNFWDHIDIICFVFFLIAGTVYCYNGNEGRKGSSFLTRYVSLAWVFGIRYTIMIVMPSGVGLYLILSLFMDLPQDTQWYDTVFNAIIRLPFYFVLGIHIRDIAINRISLDKMVSGYRDKHAEDFDQSRYPTILRRYMATFIDILFVSFILIILAFILQGEGNVESMIRIGIALTVVCLYEPLFTSRLCTLGQRIMGIRVRKTDGAEKISILDSYLRTIIKLLLGFISFFPIPLTRKRRALHDFVARSVVIYAGQE